MSLGVLNNISAIYAQNNLSNTQNSLQKTLQQLSSGSRINSGADDAAGLSLANGLQASASALSQSAKNASQGVFFLQIADGSLSQITSLLNRAVTLATQASNSTLNSSQVGAANSEYQKILTEVDTINNNTEYNGINTFAKNSAYSVANASDVVNIGVASTDTATVTFGSKSLVLNNSGGAASVAGTSYKLAATDTITNVASAINQAFGSSVATVQGNQLVLSGGAKIGASLTNSYSVAATSTPATVTVANAADIIKAGAGGITYTSTTGSVAHVLTGAFAAGGAGGTIAQLTTAINAIDAGAASVGGNVLTVDAAAGHGSLTGVVGLTESGAGVTSATVGAVQIAAATDLTDKVSIPVSGVGSVTSLTVGKATDTISPGGVSGTNDLQIKATGGSAVSISGAFMGGGAGGNLSTLAAAINTQFGSAGVNATISGNTMNISGGALSQKTAATTTESETVNTAANQSVAIFTSDGTVSQSYNNNASDLVQASSSALALAGTDLTSTTGAQNALSAINSAITSVAASRGTIGANINTLNAVVNVMNTQSTNTLAAENDVTATDYGQATSQMSKFQILSQTGIAALSQANQSQQLITKLLQ